MYQMPNRWQPGCWQDLIWRNILAKSMMILIAGPYRSGTGDDPEKMAANVRSDGILCPSHFSSGTYSRYWANGLRFLWSIWQAQNRLEMKHSTRSSTPSQNGCWKNVMQFCRVGGASQGADLMVEVARKNGLQIYTKLEANSTRTSKTKWQKQEQNAPVFHFYLFLSEM